MGCCQSCCGECPPSGKGYLARIPDGEQKGKRYLKKDAAFSDEAFSMSAIEANLGPTTSNFQLEWKNVTDITPVGDDVFPEQIHPWDLRQGKLGNCPLLSAAAAIIARDEGFIRRVFKTTKVNTSNAYHLQFHTPSGDWNEITIDGQIPCVQQQVADSHIKPAFATYGTYQGAPKVVWPMLLEKAYGKHYRSYAAINSANIAEAMVDLTGLPVESINLKSQQSQSQQTALINNVSHLISNQQAAITAGMPTSTTSHHKKLKNGLTVGHAYAVLDLIYILEYSIFIIRLYNPWGNKKTGYWLGDWGPTSELWTEDLRYRYGCRDEREKGIFCMPVKDCFSIFDCLNICYLSVQKSLVSDSLSVGAPGHRMRIVRFPNRHQSIPSPGGRDFVSFRHNDAYLLHCPHGGDFICTVGHQEQRGVVQPGTISYPPIGFVILKPLCWQPGATSPSVLLPGEYEIAYKNTYWNRREVSSRTSLPPSTTPYICIPSCYYPQSQGYNYLCMYASVNISVSAVTWDLKLQIRKSGTWSQTTKKRFKLVSRFEGPVTIFLCQQSMPGGPATSFTLSDSDHSGARTWQPAAHSTREARSATGLNNIRLSIRNIDSGAVSLSPYQGTAEVISSLTVTPGTEYVVEPQVSKYDRETLKFEISIYAARPLEFTPI
eukprot:TRINITY_DN16071_c0_g1_i1.p1 TRINITY_DN16071_c0_g1~~TRINITY_DN16071_c0_g1_i1.p1  ORF type:complete len:660 (+),score=71.27 TRINITY_DN16071_c0_g1_i1:58-2037(+)